MWWLYILIFLIGNVCGFTMAALLAAAGKDEKDR